MSGAYCLPMLVFHVHDNRYCLIDQNKQTHSKPVSMKSELETHYHVYWNSAGQISYNNLCRSTSEFRPKSDSMLA